jgi:hypothetical protein
VCELDVEPELLCELEKVMNEPVDEEAAEAWWVDHASTCFPSPNANTQGYQLS